MLKNMTHKSLLLHIINQRAGEGENVAITIAVSRQDGRQKAAAAALEQAGYRVVRPQSEICADVLLLPMPFQPSQEELNQLIKCVKPNGMVLAGMPSKSAVDSFEQRQIEVQDYAKCEELTLLNAIPTAEGCLQILMNLRTKTIWNSRILITGFGRIAKLLARDCMTLGAKVSIAARNPAQRAEAAAWGCDTLSLKNLKEKVLETDIAINTVPFLLFDAEVLTEMNVDCLLIDLASSPGGVDFEQAEHLGIRTEWARGLPPKYAPETAGEILAQTVQTILQEREGEK